MRRRWILATLVLVALSGAVSASFLIGSSGRSMTGAAQQFLATLDDDQRESAVMSFDDAARVDWHFIPKDTRKGVRVKDMSPQQRRAAKKLLRTCLSRSGFDKATAIMALEGVLHELEKENPGRFARETDLYYFTLFGDPTRQGRWGLSIEGHHLSLNFVVEDGEVISSTPTVLCANPTIVSEALANVPRGTRVLAAEELSGFHLLESLDDEQRATAVFAEEAPREIRAAGEAQPPQDAAVGLPASEMTRRQKVLLWTLLSSYLSTVNTDVMADRLVAIDDAGFDNVHFAWAGADKPGIGHYYRIQGPSFLVEFVNTQPDAAGNIASHIHSIWRDMDGDFALPAAE